MARIAQLPPYEVGEGIFFVRYEPHRMFVPAVDMSPQVELAHRRLCDYYWSTGHWLQAPGPDLAGLLRCEARVLPRVLRGLFAAGWRKTRGRLQHPWPRAVLRAARAAHREAVQRGKLGRQLQLDRAPGQPAWEPPGYPAPAAPRQDKDKDNHKYNNKKRRGLSRLPAERSALSAKAGAVGNEPVAQFLQEVRELFPDNPKRADTELANWGGWWTNRFRENPDKARRVLAEVASMVGERRMTSNPGAAAFDLWKRLP